jgi:alkanesulfonate monooxygenase SsuD/methylene tetrahydromethanopterin reductase-like flavin-dependent oxidoreductase (luciferase family)
MQFALMLTLSERYNPGTNMAKSLREATHLVTLAREYGFDGIMSGEHILAYPHQRPAPIPALSYLSAVAEGMHVGTSVLLLPLHPPVQVAEDFAALDGMTNGRAILGVGLGYREDEFGAFGINPKERVGRMYEGLEVIKQLWTQEEVEFNGKYFRVPLVKPTAKTVQRPHPPIWVGAGVDAAVRRVAQRGYTWLIHPPRVGLAEVAAQVGMYRDVLKQHGHAMPAIQPMRYDGYLAHNSDVAWKEAEALFEWHYGVLHQWGLESEHKPGDAPGKSFREVAGDRYVIGTPDDAIKAFERCERELGVNFIILRLNYVGMSFEDKMRQIRLFGEGVVPHFKKKR